MTPCAGVRARLWEADEVVLSHLEHCEDCASFAEGTPLVLPDARPDVPAFDPRRLGVERAMAGRRRRAWMRRARPFAAAAVVASLVTAGVFLFTTPEARRLLPGEMLVSLDGPREALLLDDVRLLLERGRTSFEQPSPNEDRLRLYEGALSLTVPKLKPGQVWSVQTRDAVVRVRGTQFRVSVAEEGTRVSVSGGIVEVVPTGKGRAAHLLRAGDQVVIEPLDTYRGRLRSQALESLNRGRPASARLPLDALLATEPEAEAGAEAAALRAFVHRSAGETLQAAELYRRFLDLLPPGSRAAWAQDACVEHALLVNTPKSWTECLERFPGGVHEGLVRSRVK